MVNMIWTWESEINLWQSTGVNVISIWISSAGLKTPLSKRELTEQRNRVNRKIYCTVQAENIRSWRMKINGPWAESIRSSASNIRSSNVDNIRSRRWKYRVHKNYKRIVNERKYTVPSLMTVYFKLKTVYFPPGPYISPRPYIFKDRIFYYLL